MSQHSLATLLTCTVIALSISACSDDTSQRQISQLRETLASVNAEVSSLQASRQVLQTRLEAAQIAARTAGNQLRTLKAQLAQSEQANASISGANRQGGQRLQQADSALSRLKGQLNATNRALKTSQAQNAKLSSKLAAVSGMLGQRDAIGQSQNNKLQNFERDLLKATTARTEEKAQLQAQLAKRNQSLKIAGSEITALTANAQRSEQMINALDSKRTALSTQVTQTRTRAEQVTIDNQRLRTQLGSIQAQLVSVQNETDQQVASLEQKQRVSNIQIAQARSRAEQLATNNSQLKSRMTKLREELANANDVLLRYRVANEHLNSKVVKQDGEIRQLNLVVNETRNHQQQSIAALGRSDQSRQRLTSNAASLLSQRDAARSQLQRLQQQLDEANQQVVGAKSAKDYLDGKLAAATKEFDLLRKQHQAEFLQQQESLEAIKRQSSDVNSAKDYLDGKLAAANKELTLVRKQHQAELLKQQQALQASERQAQSSARAKDYLDGKLAAASKQVALLRQQYEAELLQQKQVFTAVERQSLGAKRAKDYLDGKLAAATKELSQTREESRANVLRVERALELSLEESRILAKRNADQRERLQALVAARDEVLQQHRQINQQLQERIGNIQLDQNALRSYISSLEKRSDTLAEQGKEKTLELKKLAEQSKENTRTTQNAISACQTSRKLDATMAHAMKSTNKALRKRIQTLETELETVRAQCKLQKTAL